MRKHRLYGLLIAALAVMMLIAVPVTAKAEENAESEEVVSPTVDIQKSGTSVKGKSFAVTLADSAVLTYSADSGDVDAYAVSWESSSTKVAKLTTNTDGSATVKAVGNGSAKITVTLKDNESGSKLDTATCIVTVAKESGFYKLNGAWYYTGNGSVMSEGLVKDTQGKLGTKNRWWYVKDSKVGCNYSGFAENKNGWWYVKEGYVDFDRNDVIKDTDGKIGNKGDWWYVVGGKVQTDFTGLADYKNSHGWWYIKKGKVDFTHNGVDKNKNGWWYVVDGKVQFGYTGLADYKNSSGWWYIKKGKVDFSANTIAKNKNGWWYVKGGKVQFVYTGFGTNSNGKWYVEKGKVTFQKNGVIKDKTGALGTAGDWYYVVGSKVQTGYTGVADYKNANGWWYIKKGKVDFFYTGVGSNKNGTWYVTKGKVTSKAGAFETAADGTVYYYNNEGKKSTGWAEINGSYYYFDRSTGAMQTNTTVDNIKLDGDGFAKASADDITRIQTMIKARDVYLSLVSSGDSQSAQLKKCFDWVLKHPYKRYRRLPEAKQQSDVWYCIYANDEFDKGSGCCASEASAFAFLAHECGYTAYICDDTSHTWVEINGKVYDTLFAESKSYSRYYGSTYATAKLYCANKMKIF